MKQIITFILVIAVGILLSSCQKEISCEGCSENNKPPIAAAGTDEIITLPTDSISLDGTSSSDPDGTISDWLWTKISGPASFNIVKPSDYVTKVKILVAGTYQFELKVTDNNGLSAKDTVQITVRDLSQPNRPPVANAGPDQTITLPINTITINGNGSTDPDNNITSFAWTKISGPSLLNIGNTNIAQIQVANLIEGVYQFELIVVDAGGLNDKDTVQVIVNPETNNPSEDIYVAGMDNGLPVYWKNGAMVAVDNAAWNFSGTSIAVVGSDIYLAGARNGLFYYEWAATSWKNGQGTPLGNYAGATSIAVVGTDVYVAGWEVENGGFVVKYWKNGQAISLSNRSIEASGNSIVVVGNDIYVAGYEDQVAKYWKNGQAVSLTNGTNQASGNSIAVVGNDIYVAGSEVNGSHHAAKYWKNGQAISLTNGSNHANATSIAVTGSDIYVAGWEGDTYGLVGGTVSVAKYWKNGQEFSLTNGTNYAYATAIAIYGSDVYVAGYEIVGGQYQPKYWKNGQAISLPSTGGWATSIVVVN